MNIFALMKKIALNNVVLAVAVLLAAGTYSFAQTPATPEQRAAAEAKYGVKNVVCKYDTHAEMISLSIRNSAISRPGISILR